MSLEGAVVLIVEDNEDLAGNLSELAEVLGAQDVRIAASADELDARELWECDVALVDIRLPGTTGLELLPKLRERGGGFTEVLLITGSAVLDDAVAAVSHGAFAYILKPFDPEALMQTLERAYERVRLRRDAARLARELERSEVRLRTLVDTVQALLLVLDEDGVVVQANPAVEAVTGVAAAELVGRSWFDEFVPNGDAAVARAAFEEARDGGASPASPERVGPRRNAGSEFRWVSWRSSVLDTPAGLRVYRSGLDVTEIRELERRARVAERLAAVGTMSAGLAHEIRNPLNAAHLQLELLRRRLARAEVSDESIQEPISVVQGEIERLSRLVTEFLQFARPAHVRLTSTDLREVARAVAELAGPALEHASVELALADEPVVVRGDAERLRGVVLNLVRNAGEAFVAAGTRGTIRIEVRADTEHAHIAVVDDGPGVPPEVAARIFEPFFSTRESGTGLGLAISHNVVAQHGGTIAVIVDGGTTMDVKIPLA